MTDVDEGRIDQDEEAVRLLLRRMITGSGWTLQQIDDRLGLARGYMCRLLGGSMRLTFRHILLILQLIDIQPGEFFQGVYSARREAPGRLRIEDLQALAGKARKASAGAARSPAARAEQPLDPDELERKITTVVYQVLANLQAGEMPPSGPEAVRGSAEPSGSRRG